MKQKDWYDKCIEEPLKPLVKLLRNNGFNTVCSCGHNPSPYVQMEWYDDAEVTTLYNLLMEKGYTKFTIIGQWDTSTGCPRRHLEVKFYIPKKLAKNQDIQHLEKLGEACVAGDNKP